MDKRVLVVDDDRLIREMTRDALADEGFTVSIAASGAEALERLRDAGPFAVMVTDSSMRGMDGLQLMESCKREHPKVDVIVLTAYASLESALQAMRLGAADYLRKPVRPSEVVYGVRRTILRQRLVAENTSLRASLQAFESSRVLTTCLEPTDVLPLTLDIALRAVGRSRAVGCLTHLTPRGGDGIVLQGFSEPEASRLRDQIEREKLLDPAHLESGVHELPADFRRELTQLGVDEDEVLALPLQLDGQVVGGIWVLSDRTPFDADELRRVELVAAQGELALMNAERFLQAREKAFVDDVTELYNVRYLMAALDREVSRAERSELKLSVLFLDLDRFKNVNDSHGHLVGSRVLRELGQTLRAATRSIDTLGRYGGDEFTLLLVDTDHETGLRVAERIRAMIESAVFTGGRGLELKLSASIGVATYPSDGSTREELLDRADKAMYLGKALGRNKVCSSGDLSS